MISFIGDVHGKVDSYAKIVRKAEYSVQVGDFGFHKQWRWLASSGLNPSNHKVLRGNHDVPPSVFPSAYCLGDYGSFTLGGISFFAVRGAHSIDQQYRTEGLDWWREEQLNYIGQASAFAAYEKARPSIVVTHECPAYLKMMLCGQAYDATSQLLDQMWELHRPSVWIHGHHHKSQRLTLLDTTFVSLAELEVFQL